LNVTIIPKISSKNDFKEIKSTIEVEFSSDSEDKNKIPVDPVPQLRNQLHLLIKEVESVRSQIAEIEKNKLHKELEIVKLQSEIKTLKIDEERQSQTNLELNNQILDLKSKISAAKNEVESARLHHMDKVHR
jgi:chromosome segregation ATPase